MRASMTCAGSLLLLSVACLTGCQELSGDGPRAVPALTAEPIQVRRGPQPLGTPTTTEIAPSPPPRLRPPLFDRDTGSPVGQPASGRTAVQRAASGGVELDFVNAEIAEVVRAVIGEALGRAYTLDPAVQGRVTLSTSGPVPPEALTGILDRALQSQGFALVMQGESARIVPVAAAAAAGVPVEVYRASSRRPEGYGIRVVPLTHGSAAQLARLIEPFAKDGATVTVDEARNLVVFAGLPTQLQTMLDMVDIFDVDWLKGQSLALFQLGTVEPARLATELEAIFGDERAAASGLRFVPLDRLASILVVARQSGQIDRVRPWIQQLDRNGDDGDVRLWVYNVQNGRAGEIASMLTAVFTPGEGGAARGGRRSSAVGPRLQPKTLARAGTTTGADAPSPPGTDGERVRSGSDEQGGVGGDTDNPLTRLLAGDGAIEPRRSDLVVPGLTDDATRIIADETNNAIVVMARPRIWRMISQVLEKLDAEKIQVLIEATIAEVTLTDELRYGVEWFLRFGSAQLRLSNSRSLSPEPLAPGFSSLFIGDDARVVINALSSVTDVNVVSTPQILVVDNETAELQIGDEVPIVTQSAQSVGQVGAPVIDTIQYRPTGVILQVLPRVNASGKALLEISQEVSDVVPTTTSTLDSPTIRQRRVRSTVSVVSGETIAIGGLIRENRNLTRDGVPLLAELPLIGPLFGTRGKNTGRTEVLVLITPHVLRNVDDARASTDELRRRVRALRPAEPTRP